MLRPSAARTADRAGRVLAAALVVASAAGLAGVAGVAQAHPTGEERAERARRAALCDAAREAEGRSGPADEAGARFDAVRLGDTAEGLQRRFGEALEPQPLEDVRGPGFAARVRRSEATGAVETADAAEVRDPYAEQARLGRSVNSPNVRSAEYDAFRGRVYRIRWRLDEAFELPVMDALVAQATLCYGAPAFDQQVEWKLGSGRSELRRVGWRHGGRLLELRQLGPLYGGPVFVTLTDLAVVEEIRAAEGSTSPDPESVGPWWERPQRKARLVPHEESHALAERLARVLAQSEFRSKGLDTQALNDANALLEEPE